MAREDTMLWLFVCLMCIICTSGFCPKNCACFNKTAVCDRTKFTGAPFTGATIPTFDANIDHLTLKNYDLGELVDNAFVKPTQVHHTMQFLKSLHIHDCGIDRIAPEAFYGLNNLQYLQIINSQLTNEGFLANYTLPALEVVNLSGNLFQRIPDSVWQMAPKLYQLVIADNKLNAVNLTDSPDLTSLKSLILSGNSFSSLHPEHFVFPNNSIMVLSLDRCNIASIHVDSFAQFPELNTLKLSGNPITGGNLVKPLQALGNNSKLQHLLLSDMKINNISATMFSMLKNVQSLNLSNNEMTSIEKDTFTGMTQLKKLVLYKNRLGSMGWATSLASLVSLNLSHNSIQTPSPLLPRQNQLQEVDLSYNNIDKIPFNWLTNQANMMLINLCCNKIKIIDQGAFKLVTAIKVDLSHNQLQQTHDFGVMTHKLDLSNNRIRHIPQATMNKLYTILDELNLSHNEITFLDDQVLSDMYTLEKLDLSYNLMGKAFLSGHHINLFNHLSHMRELNLAYNGITQFPEEAQFVNNAQLRRLSLRGNKIESFQTFLCNNLARSLQYLDLSQNHLNTIDRVCVSKMLFLKEADFSNNPLVCTCPLAEFMHWLNDTHHASISIRGLEDKEKYHCYNPRKWKGKSLLDYRPVMGSCDFHPRADGVNSTVVGITIGLVLVGIIILAMVLYFGKVCQKLKTIQYNWQIRYKEVYDGDQQVII